MLFEAWVKSQGWFQMAGDDAPSIQPTSDGGVMTFLVDEVAVANEEDVPPSMGWSMGDATALCQLLQSLKGGREVSDPAFHGGVGYS